MASTREEKYHGIILTSYDYREYDRIYEIYTYEKGLLICQAKSVKKVGAKMASILSPFKLIKFDLVIGRTLPIIKGAVTKKNFISNQTKTKIQNLYALLSINESFLKAVPSAESSEELFTLLLSSYIGIEKNSKKLLFVTYKIYKLLKGLGYEPVINGKGIGSKISSNNYYTYNFNSSSLTHLNRNNNQSMRLTNNTLKMLRIFSKKEWVFVKRIVLNKHDLLNLAMFIQHFYHWHIGKNLNSLRYFMRNNSDV